MSILKGNNLKSSAPDMTPNNPHTYFNSFAIKRALILPMATVFGAVCLSTALVGCGKQSGHQELNQQNHSEPYATTTNKSDAQPDHGMVNDTNHTPFRGLVVTNHPLYLLALEATRGVESPRAILPKGETGHHHAMSPSSRKLINDAAVIYWFGATMEAPLAPLLSSMHDSKHKTIALLDKPRLKVLPARDGQKRAVIGTSDPHLWLNPKRAVQIVELIAKEQSARHPKYADTYQNNVSIFRQKIQTMLERTQQKFRKNLPYISYHDAYQYIEPELHMVYLGSIVQSPELPIKPKQLLALKAAKQTLVDDGAESAICILSEHQGIEARIEALKPYRLVHIDPSMSGYDDYIDAWQSIAQKISSCHA